MTDLVLRGCRSEPLGSYLKAVGVLRLVAEQVDARATGCWAGDVLVLSSDLDEDGLVAFLVDSYRPTPIVTPWNNGTGFTPAEIAKNGRPFKVCETLASSTDVRLSSYREAIAAARELASSQGWSDLAKQQQIALCRNSLPDEALGWLDAAVVLTTDSRAFPPLLGTGGNDGRLDFGVNFMERVGDLLRLVPKPPPADRIRDMARSALLGRGHPRLDQVAIGQFDPAAAGGPGSAPAGGAESLANPWDFVLLFEGAVTFASGAARRLAVGPGGTSVPFSVASAAAGHSSATDEASRGEFWAPVWRRPTSFAELRRLVAEGRAEYRGRQARNGLDVARALASLGVDRGVDEFIRYGFLERNGLATFSVPVGRFGVPTSPRAAVAVVGQVDSWLSAVWRTPNAPATLVAARRRIDSLQFELAAADPQHAPPLAQRLLIEVAVLERLASRSRSVREAAGQQVRGLRARDWLPVLADDSSELAVAAAIASLRGRDEPFGWLRGLLVDQTWSGRPPKVAGFATRPLYDVLSDALLRLLTKPQSPQGAEEAGCFNPASALWAPPRAVAQFVNGELDLDRLSDLIGACLLFEHGYQCDRGEIYFAETRERRVIEFDEALVERTMALLADLRRVAVEEEPPPPLMDSPKCPRCSLVGVCLPDEMNALAERSALPPRRLTPRDGAASPLYVTEQGAYIGVRDGRVTVSKNRETVGEARLIDVSQVNVVGNAQISSQAIRVFFRREIPVLWFSYGGWFSGLAEGLPTKNVELRRRQAGIAFQAGLPAARRMVYGKIRNSRTLLMRNSKQRDEVTIVSLKALAEQALTAERAESLLGIEGTAARLYFAQFPTMLRSDFEFNFARRNRRPPLDPVNCLLSYLYGLIVKDFTAIAFGVGFDPYLGVYHKPRFGRPALALDLAEEFRPLVAESVVVSMINNGEIRRSDFIERTVGVSLTDTGRRKVITAYERRMDTEVRHPVFGYSVSYRRTMEVQARLLAAYMMREVPEYVAFVTR